MKTTLITLTLIYIFFIQYSVIAQQHERCAAHKCAEYKGFNVNEITNYANTDFKLVNVQTNVVLPVVVHVVHNEASGAITGTNISEAQVKSAIDRLNEDFNGENPELANVPAAFQDVTAYDGVGIRFRLAEVDPDGNTTNGITRTYTDKTNFSYEVDDVKRELTGGANGWARDNYLNIWVCPDINNGGALGYAQFPNPNDDALTDGLCIAHNYFGDNTGAVNETDSGVYYKGRTLVHEMGHFFGLTHIWGNDNGNCVGDDGVIDTPMQADSYYGCPEAGTESCGSLDMYMNYMDYTDDECMYLFSEDQAQRMLEVLNTHTTRVGLLTAGEHAFPECTANAGTVLSPTEFSVCFNGFTEQLSVINHNENYQQIWVIAEPNGTVVGYQLGDRVNFTGFEPAYYGVTVINCLPSSATEVFDLIDSKTWTVTSLASGIADNGLCADIQKFGYPLFTYLTESESVNCITSNNLNLQQNFTLFFESNLLIIKGNIEFNDLELKIYDSTGKLLFKDKSTENQFIIPNVKGLIIVKLSNNFKQHISKFYLH